VWSGPEMGKFASARLGAGVMANPAFRPDSEGLFSRGFH